MSEQINLQDVKEKLYEKLKPSGWGLILRTFIMSSEFDTLLLTLLKEVNDSKRFTPVLKQVFRAFEECPYDKLKIVIMGQDSYPQPFVADGIAFSCSNTNKPEASLRFIHKEIAETVYSGKYTGKADLKDWSNQGILLINTALTTTIGKVGAHYQLWQPFMAFLFDILTFQNPGLIYVFMGKVAQNWAESVPDNNWKIFTSHPASAAYNNLESWNSDDCFNKINEIMKKNNVPEIIW